MATLKLQPGLALERHPLDVRVQALTLSLDAAVRGAPSTLSCTPQLAVAAVVADGPISLKLSPHGLTAGDMVVADELSRHGWLMRLFLDGVRGLRIGAPLVDDVPRLVALLRRELPGEDLVTGIWGAGIGGLSLELEAVPGSAAKLPAGARALLARCEGPAPRKHDGQHPTGSGFSVDALVDALLAAGPDIALPALSRQADAWLVDQDWPALVSLVQRLARTGQGALQRALLTPRRMAALGPAIHDAPEQAIPAFALLAQDAPFLAAGFEAMVETLPSGPVSEAFVSVLQDRGLVLTGVWLRQLEGDDPERALAAFELLRLHGGRSRILVSLRCRHPQVREAALRSLGAPADRVDLERVAAMLHDSSQAVRVLATQQLVESESSQATRLLLAAARSDKASTEDKVRLIGALAERRDPRTLPWFDELLHKWTAVDRRTEVAVQLAAVAAIVSLKCDEGDAILRSARGRWVLAPAVRAAIEEQLARAVA